VVVGGVFVGDLISVIELGAPDFLTVLTTFFSSSFSFSFSLSLADVE